MKRDVEEVKQLEAPAGVKTCLEKIKRELRDWYASLSVREIVSNRALIEEIEKFERLLSGQKVVTC